MKEVLGKTCLYKGKESQLFEGKDVKDRLKEGWKDHPHEITVPKKTAPKKDAD